MYQDPDDVLGLRNLTASGRLFYYRSPHAHDSLSKEEVARLLVVMRVGLALPKGAPHLRRCVWST